jgi:AcrR family transcriptional regulator
MDDHQPVSVPVGGRAPGTLSLGSRSLEPRGLPRGDGNVSRSFVVHSQRERILDALANLSSAQGYGASTIPEIVQEAAVSVQAFYEHFSGKEDVFLVAYEIGHRKARAIVERAYKSQEDWPEGVRAGIAALFDFLASEPSFAHLAIVDALTASPKTATAAQEGTGAYARLLEPGLELGVSGDSARPGANTHSGNHKNQPAPTSAKAHDNAPASITVEATTSALLELCMAYVATERVRELPSLAALASDLALRPFLTVPVS